MVHPRVAARHPDLTEEDVTTAWENAAARGQMIEMVGAELEGGGVLIYHAMRLTAKMARELRLGS